MNSIPTLLLTATLLPFFAFWIILIAGPKLGKAGAYVSIGAIFGAAICSFASLALWINPYDENSHWPAAVEHGSHNAEEHDGGHGDHTSTNRALHVRPVS